MWLLLLFVSRMYLLSSCSSGDHRLRVYSPGDIIVGGLFPIHLQTTRVGTPPNASCVYYDVQMFLLTQVMIFAIHEINQRRVLPNIIIGYDIHDTCGDVSLAIEAVLKLLKGKPDPEDCSLPGQIGSVLPEPHAKVVIGERYSEVSISVARILALPSVTQISYGSTSMALSEKLKFPSFLRTIPSDAHQTMAIAALVTQFNWQTVGVVGSDDEYGKYGAEGLIDIFTKMQVCVDFKEILPVYFSANETETHVKLGELMKEISSSTAEAIILFTKDTNIQIIMEEAIQLSLNRTWIASDVWSMSKKIMGLPGVHKIGQVFGFIPKGNEVPGFEDYVTKMGNETTDPLWRQLRCHHPTCSRCSQENDVPNSPLTDCKPGLKGDQLQCLNTTDLLKFIDQDESYNIYLAVNIIAEGLRSLLKCNSEKCERDTNFKAWELLEEIKRVNCTLGNTKLHFDPNGDPSIGYDVLEWVMDSSECHIKKIGEYLPPGPIKILNSHLVEKYCNVTVTVHNCFKTCAPGHELKDDRGCCKTCHPCKKGYSSLGGRQPCEPCGDDEYTSSEKHMCLNRTVTFLEWSDGFAIALAFFEKLGIVATIMVAVLFAFHRNTPVVKAIGGYLCFLELLSLLACFCSVYTFFGKPTKASCRAGLPLFGMAFTLCISCILANLFQICVGFTFDLRQGGWLKRLNQPVAVVALCFSIQLTLCVLWLTYHPPFPIQRTQNTNDNVILMECSKGSKVYFGCMVGYIALLAIICFLFAFKGKRLPDLYKNASFITISMLLFLVMWILFIPVHINASGKYPRAIEAATILVSTYSILCCHFAPKCYIILFRKEINNENAITEYIKKHYEQKGMPIVKS